MPLITVSGLGKSFGERRIMSGVDFSIGDGERIGLVGRNGSGKTTLLRMICGIAEPDEGTVSIQSGLSMEYLRQEFRPSTGRTLHNFVIEAFSRVFDIEKRIRETGEALAREPENDALLKRLGDLQHEFEIADGYGIENRVERVLSGLGFSEEQLASPVNSLSGGEQTKAALAQILAKEPELLLLDEPTNHLDLWALSWLEDFLPAFKGSIVIISHDRYFLDRVATRIIELRNQRCCSFKGNYSEYTASRAKMELEQRRRYDGQQRYIKHQEEFIRRYHPGQRYRQARGRRKRLDRLERIEQPVGSKDARVRFDKAKRTSYMVFSLRDVSKSFGERCLFKRLNLEITRGERVGIIGPNGSGKTTLVRIVLGKEEADLGEVLRGSTGDVGYFDQKQQDLDEHKTVLEELAGVAPEAKEGDLRSLAARFLFTGDNVLKRVSVLSGGEKAMLSLAKMMAKRPAVMVLDEPTNHLDISSREAVEDALCEFDGTLVIISHDRRVLDTVADSIFLLDGRRGKSYLGNYSFYLHESKREEREAREKEAAAAKARKVDPRAQKKVKQREKRQLEREISGLEKQIISIEEELALINGEFESGSEIYRDSERLRLATRKAEELKKQLAASNLEWGTLVDRLGQFDVDA